MIKIIIYILCLFIIISLHSAQAVTTTLLNAQTLEERTNDTDSISRQFKAWARNHAHELHIDFDEFSLADAGLKTFEAIHDIVGEARVVAIGEPFHGGHEPLAIRNILIRYLVTELGFTAVALETGLSPSKLLYDYVLLKADVPDSVLAGSFSYGFGQYRENLELLHWLRSYNAERSPSDRVRVYGVDIGGHVFPPVNRSLDAVLAFLEEADSTLAEVVQMRLADAIDHFRIDRFIEFPEADQVRIAIEVDDLITLIRRRRNDLTAATSRDAYDWVLRQTLNAGWDVAYMRLAPLEFVAFFVAGEDAMPDPREMLAFVEVREAAIAENLRWVLGREGAGGRVVFFAHNVHVQTHPLNAPAGQGLISMVDGGQYSGMYLRSLLEEDLVVMGVHFGETSGFRVKMREMDPDGLEALLSTHGVPTYIFDLRRLPPGSPLADWFSGERVVRDHFLGEHFLRPGRAYDAILYIDRVTPARR